MYFLKEIKALYKLEISSKIERNLIPLEIAYYHENLEQFIYKDRNRKIKYRSLNVDSIKHKNKAYYENRKKLKQKHKVLEEKTNWLL